MLSVFYNAQDISLSQSDFNIGEFTTIVTNTDYIYVGYYKPINSLYFHSEQVNTNESVMSIDYYNGTTFTPLVGLVDRTEGFTKRNFIDWSRNQEDEAVITVNAIEQYWYRISLDVDSTDIIFNGINLLFSNDDHIKGLKPWILDARYYGTGTTSYVAYHQEARDLIIQRMRNEGKVKVKNSKLANINQFDILDRFELQMASRYMALSLIYSDRFSDNANDKYVADAKRYMEMGLNNLSLYLLSLDEDDDGKEDTAEPIVISHRITRV